MIVWDVDSRKRVATLEGHEGAVTAVNFSPAGKRLASASADQTVMLWDVEKPLATLEGHKDRVMGVAFSPDGKRLASASQDHTVILWDLDLDHLNAEACRTANRNLTCEEWRNYIGADKPYRKTCERCGTTRKVRLISRFTKMTGRAAARPVGTCLELRRWTTGRCYGNGIDDRLHRRASGVCGELVRRRIPSTCGSRSAWALFRTS